VAGKNNTKVAEPDLPVRGAMLEALAREGVLGADAFMRARTLAGLAPDNTGWIKFLDRAMGLGGALLLATAAVFFIAFNWTEMGRFAKLALLEGAVVAACIAGLWKGPHQWMGRAALFAATVLTGALLAFVGQTYQTGADPWQLFAAWAALSLPWALAAAWSPLWALVLVVANVGLALYMGTKSGFLGTGWIPSSPAAVMALTVFNSAAAGLAETMGPRGEDGAHRLLPRLAATLALAAATVGGLWNIVGEGNTHLLVCGACFAAIVAAYRYWRLDLMILSVASLAAIVVITTAVAKLVIHGSGGFGMFLVVGATVIALSAAAAHWIKGLARKEAP
jgi:uncharacterized membrane protein